MRAALRGDCHTHSDWSDGGSPPGRWREAARDLGHEWIALTDHSPRLTVASGLSAERPGSPARRWSPELNAELAPFRILTGIEVDILDDGSLDQREDLLGPARRGGGQRALQAADAVGADDRADGRRRSATRTWTCSGHCTGRLLGGPRARPRVGVRRRRRCSAPAASTASRWRSTAGPSAGTRPDGCCAWPPRWAACSPSTPTRTRPASSTGWTTAASARKQFGIGPDRVINTRTAGELAATAP